MVVGLTLAVVAVLVVGVFVFSRTRDHGVAHPDQWDPRVLDIVHFDEKHRGLDFKHPVFIDFLTPEQYGERARTDPDQLSDEDKKTLESQAGELRALGLVQGDVDLFAAENDLADSGTAAFYDPDTQRVSVRGSDMTVELRVTLAHELTHALQDQYFGVGTKRTAAVQDLRRSDRVSRAGRRRCRTHRGRVRRRASPTPSSRSTPIRTARASRRRRTSSPTVPDALQAFMAAPYLYGPPFAELLDADGGQTEVDDAFKHPPVDDEQQIDPRQFVHDRGPLDVDKPSLPDGVKDELDSGDFGATEWYLMLAERIPPQDALEATDGWGGDAYVAFEQDGKTCMRLAWKGDSPTDFDEMHARARPVGRRACRPASATVREDGDLLRVETCDPGEGRRQPSTDRSLDALTLIEARSYLTVGGMQDGRSVDEGFDYAQCVIGKLPFDTIVKVTTSQDKPPASFLRRPATAAASNAALSRATARARSRRAGG